MPFIDKTALKPVSIVAFLLTCIGSLFALIAICLTSWWSVNSSSSRIHHGVWSRQDCRNFEPDDCSSGSATQLASGEEAFFVSKIFATFTVLLSLVAVILHIAYAVTRFPIVRTAAIFMLGSAGLFGLLSVFVFIGFYNTIEEGEPSTDSALYLFLFATLICLVAAAFTIWASVRKAADFQLTTDEDK